MAKLYKKLQTSFDYAEVTDNKNTSSILIFMFIFLGNFVVLYLKIGKAPLTVQTNQKRSQCDERRGKRPITLGKPLLT